jgi:hypothetical protein
MPVATACGMVNGPTRGYSRHMNEHAVSTEAGGYIFAFSISRMSLRIAGLFAVSAGVIIAVVANATEPFRAPLGIALGVLAITLLIAHVVNSSSRRQKLEPAPTTDIGDARTTGYQVKVGKIRSRKSVASELALLADLRMKGALSDEEFSAAKRRILEG